MQVNYTHPKSWLIIGFGSTVVLLIFLSTVVLFGFSGFMSEFESVVGEKQLKIRLANKMRNAARERSMQLNAMLMSEDVFERDEHFMKMRAFGADFMRSRIKLAKMANSEDEKKFFNNLLEITNVIGGKQYQVIDLLQDDKTEQAMLLLIREAIPEQTKVVAKLDNYIARQEQFIKEILNKTQHQSHTLIRTIITVCIFGVLLSLLIAYIVSDRISHILNALKNSQIKELTIRDNMLDAVLIADTSGFIQSCNKATEKIFGYSASYLEGKNLKVLMHSPEAENHDAYMQRYLDTGEKKIIGYAREVSGRTKQGDSIPLRLGVTEVELEKERFFIGILRDITAQKKAEQELIVANQELERRVLERTRELEDANQQLSHMARHDTVTGLANRALFQEQLQLLMAHAKRNSKLMAIYFLDLDGFKQVNDSYGHEVGDQLLRQVAERIKQTVREEDLVARIGGDEFAVLASRFDNKKDITRISETIVSCLKQPFMINDKRCDIGVSIGISLFPEHGDDAKTLVQYADVAMYQVKHSGKNNYAIYKPK